MPLPAGPQITNGCICCTLRGDLAEEVGRLAAAGCYDYCVIESTGIGEPMQARARHGGRGLTTTALATLGCSCRVLCGRGQAACIERGVCCIEQLPPALAAPAGG